MNFHIHLKEIREMLPNTDASYERNYTRQYSQNANSAAELVSWAKFCSAYK